MNEVDNDPAAQAVEIVMNYIKKNPSLGLSVQLLPIEGNRTDSKKFLENGKFFSHVEMQAIWLCKKRAQLNVIYSSLGKSIVFFISLSSKF